MIDTSSYLTKSERIEFQISKVLENFKYDRLRLYSELKRISEQNDVIIEVGLKPINDSTKVLGKIGNKNNWTGEYEITTNIISKSEYEEETKEGED